jgi:hypothetical protein
MSKIVAYACSTRPNALWSAAQYDSAAPKNRTECDIPLVAVSEANVFKAKSIARGKLLERFRCHVQEVVEHAEDEGDRVYFGTSNHFEYLKEIAEEMDMWGWDAVIRERDEVDPYADLRKVSDENRALTEERDRLREENEMLMYALAPFAAVAKHDIGADEVNSDFFQPMEKNNHADRLRVGHFRQALNTLGDSDDL